MNRLYVGSEVGQLKRVLLNRPERALTHLTPSNCQELLFDDVLAVEAAGEEHDIFAKTLVSQGVDVLLLHNLLVETLEVEQAKEWLLTNQISDYRFGPTFASDLRHYLAEMTNESLATILLGGLAYSELRFSPTLCCQKCTVLSTLLLNHYRIIYLLETPLAGFMVAYLSIL